MWPVWIVSAIVLAAVAFMLRFLIALLREGAPSVCYWVVPVRQKPGKHVQLKTLGGACFDDNRCATEYNRGDYYADFLENEGHAKEEHASDLIALDVRPASVHLGWRSIHPNRGNVFRERQL
jgi:hypothetical protein